MTSAARRPHRRPPALVAASLAALLLTACTGRGGGQLPAGPGFDASASFGFSFSCEDPNLRGSTGQLRIQLSYTERSSVALLPSFSPSVELLSPFTVHGVVDELEAVDESMVCSGQEPSPGGGELIFLGRYRVTSTSAGFPSSCSGNEITTSSCRFEVVVQDADRDLAPSQGDTFAIKLSTVTGTTSALEDDCPPDAVLPCYVSELPAASVFYARAGVLSGGEITVDD